MFIFNSHLFGHPDLRQLFRLFLQFFSVILTKPSLKKHNIDNTCISQPTILQMSDFAAMFVFFLFANAGTF